MRRLLAHLVQSLDRDLVTVVDDLLDLAAGLRFGIEGRCRRRRGARRRGATGAELTGRTSDGTPPSVKQAAVSRIIISVIRRIRA
ncbi:hypothetical protein AB0B57_33975 [Micromonospora sp. NPDC049101]|uniref:hypothetical protein n=1 Tax=Micromonospora sp. NPDC049101 TaxID=3155032 RepID=UPI0033D308F7